jgi:signal peptidase
MKAARLGLDALFLVVVLLVVGLLLALRVVPSLTAWAPLTLLGPSMEPTYPVGTLVYIDKAGTVTEGSVITYQNGTLVPITHRVTAITSDWSGAGIAYITQGDGNPNRDALPVTPDHVLGTVSAAIPIIGIPAWILSQPVGTIAIVSLALLLILLRSFTSTAGDSSA